LAYIYPISSVIPISIVQLNAPEPLEVTALTPVSVPAILQARLLREPATR
jgi:hypothetical protein